MLWSDHEASHGKMLPVIAISIVALVVSTFALPFTIWAARAAARQAQAAHDQTQIQREQVTAAREQTRLQCELAQEAAQPYVWADIQPDMQQGTLLYVAVGNSGPTVASNVKVSFSPPLPRGHSRSEEIERIERVLANGLRSLAPGRVIYWTLGRAFDILAKDDSQPRTVRVHGEGPYGPLPVLEHEIDISEWRESRDAPEGSLHEVRGAIRDLTTTMNRIDVTMKQGFDRLEFPMPQTITARTGRSRVARHRKARTRK